ncbi:AEC family transporter [Psychrosphaera aestuarii]|uniref:AEC family transporter n=1 Tax=Psychrosphaera aestuarii TaxID=1266052 RepID=UPI001B31DD8B|nr:AEC family transporter [Psychrosphaera aestuarii]
MITFSIILPLAIICFLGFLLARFKWLSKHQIDSLSSLCFTFLIPLFLFKSTSQTDLSSGLSWTWFAAMYLGILITFFGLFTILKKVGLRSNANASVSSLTGTYSNTVLISIPVLIGLLGEKIAGQAFVLIAFHSAMLFIITELYINSLTLKNIIKSLKNPIVVSISAGLLFNLSGVKLPNLLLQPLDMISTSAIPLALFGLGAAMNYLPIKGNRSEAFVLSVIKLIMLPGVVYLLATYLFKLPSQATLIVVLLTASPTGVNAFILSAKHKVQEGISATTVVFSTSLSVITVTAWSYFLTH